MASITDLRAMALHQSMIINCAMPGATGEEVARTAKILYAWLKEGEVPELVKAAKRGPSLTVVGDAE